MLNRSWPGKMESINAYSLSGTVTWVWKNQKRQLKESEKQNDYWTISVKWVANAPLKLEGEKKNYPVVITSPLFLIQ